MMSDAFRVDIEGAEIAIFPSAEKTLRLFRYGAYFLAAVLSCAVALYNAFSLTYSDTGTYIANARDIPGGRQPWFFDRPVTYGLFLIPFKSLYTLWLVPLAQGFLVAFAVDLTLRSVSISLSTPGFLALFAGLSTFTSLRFFSGQVMPDIFTSLVIAKRAA